MVGETESEARAMRERLIDRVPREAVGVWLSHNTGFDMSTLPPRFSLRELNESIGALLEASEKPGTSAKLDFATKAHLSECKSEIYRVLNAPHIKFPETRLMMLGGRFIDQKQQQEVAPPQE